MKKEHTIEEGDMVCVDFNSRDVTLCDQAEVLHVPAATGDSWIFRDPGKPAPHFLPEMIYYVSEGCTLTLLRKKGVKLC